MDLSKKWSFFLVLLQSFKFSVHILLEKNTPFVRKKFDCEKRDKSIWNALIGCVAQAKFHFRHQKIDFQDLTNSINVKFRYEIIFGRNQCSTSSYEEICVQKTVVTILNYVLDISHNHDFDGSIESFDISSSFSFTNLRFPMYNLLQKNQSPGGQEVRLRETNWINLKRIHWMFCTVEISMQRSDFLIFQSHHTL